jgi:hypothetical protein
VLRWLARNKSAAIGVAIGIGLSVSTHWWPDVAPTIVFVACCLIVVVWAIVELFDIKLP